MRSLCLLTLIALVPMAASTEDDWYPSRYGADDTLGALNELSPESVLAAVRLVKTGKSYALGVETSRETPAYGARSFELFAVGHADGGGEPWGSTSERE